MSNERQFSETDWRILKELAVRAGNYELASKCRDMERLEGGEVTNDIIDADFEIIEQKQIPDSF